MKIKWDYSTDFEKIFSDQGCKLYEHFFSFEDYGELVEYIKDILGGCNE